MGRLVRIGTIRSPFRISFAWRQKFSLSARRIPAARRRRRRREAPQRGHAGISASTSRIRPIVIAGKPAPARVGVLFGLQGIPAVYYGTGPSPSALSGDSGNLPGSRQRTRLTLRAAVLPSAVGQSNRLQHLSFHPWRDRLLANSRCRRGADDRQQRRARPFSSEVIVDADLNRADGSSGVLYSNSTKPCPARSLCTAAAGSGSTREPDGSMRAGLRECCRSRSGRWKCRSCAANRSVSYEATLTLLAECSR